MTERIQPDNRSDNQPDSQSDTEQTIQPTDLNESAAPSPTEQAPTADASPADPAVEAVASTQTSTPQTHADVESSKEPEPGEPADQPVEQSTATSSDEPASHASDEPAQTEQPTEKVQATETTSEDATPTPAEVPAPAAASAAPAEPAVDPQEAMDAAKWGRVDGEGRVYVQDGGAELRELLESWKAAQRRGPRLDRPTEDGLWKRFSHARTTFDRHRRQFFSELDAKQAQVRAAKEALIKRAEEMQTSTDWAGTSAKYRDLLAEWKKAGRASRKEDDALWARFRAAQQVFYDARRAKDEAVDAEFAENLKVKEALVAKAEALLPIKDIKAAKKALRPIQDAWEEAGRVPRGAVRRIEGRMRAVEDAIREAENAEWRRTDPETKARAEGLAGQLQDAIAGLEKDLAAAQAAGDAKKIAEAEAALTARRAWLEQVLRSAKA